MVRFWTSLIACAVVGACASSRNIEPLTREHISCLVDAAARLDDEVSDVASIGFAAQSACSATENAILSAGGVDFRTAYATRRKFELRFAQMAAEIVLAKRKIGIVEMRQRLARGEPIVGG